MIVTLMEFVICIMANANVIFPGKDNLVKPKFLNIVLQIVGVMVFVKRIISVHAILDIPKINQVLVSNVKMGGIFIIAKFRKKMEFVQNLTMLNL